jgi:hypothetical protein
VKFGCRVTAASILPGKLVTQQTIQAGLGQTRWVRLNLFDYARVCRRNWGFVSTPDPARKKESAVVVDQPAAERQLGIFEQALAGVGGRPPRAAEAYVEFRLRVGSVAYRKRVNGLIVPTQRNYL